MAEDFNTFGLHTLGKVLNGTELVEEVITITTSRTDVYTQILHHIYPELKIRITMRILKVTVSMKVKN